MRIPDSSASRCGVLHAATAYFLFCRPRLELELQLKLSHTTQKPVMSDERLSGRACCVFYVFGLPPGRTSVSEVAGRTLRLLMVLYSSAFFVSCQMSNPCLISKMVPFVNQKVLGSIPGPNHESFFFVAKQRHVPRGGRGGEAPRSSGKQ